MPRTLSPDDVTTFRRELCDVAERLFAEHGVAAVSMRALADEVGVSRMTPYRYFEDKAAILAAVRARGFERLADATDATAVTESDPARRLRELGRTYLAFAREHPQAYRVMYEISQQREDAYPDLVHQIQRSQAALRTAVVDAIDIGTVQGDPDDVTHVLWAGLHGLNALHLADKLHLDRDIDHLGTVMIDALARGVRTTDSSPQAPTIRGVMSTSTARTAP